MINNKPIIISLIITMLLVIFLIMNIEIRDERIWQLEVENKDLKEQIYQFKRKDSL